MINVSGRKKIRWNFLRSDPDKGFRVGSSPSFFRSGIRIRIQFIGVRIRNSGSSTCKAIEIPLSIGSPLIKFENAVKVAHPDRLNKDPDHINLLFEKLLYMLHHDFDPDSGVLI